VHAVESKLKVALDLADDRIDETSHKLFASALSDLHFLALLSVSGADSRALSGRRRGRGIRAAG